MCKEIQLTRGLVALVDDEDYDELSKYKWSFDGRSYARRREGGASIRMHIQLMGKIDGLEIDHINGNGLDNRRRNLRRVTHAQNTQNRKPNKSGSSIYKGVSWNKKSKNWRATIGIEGTIINLGSFENELDAAEAYKSAAILLVGEYAWQGE